MFSRLSLKASDDNNNKSKFGLRSIILNKGPSKLLRDLLNTPLKVFNGKKLPVIDKNASP